MSAGDRAGTLDGVGIDDRRGAVVHASLLAVLVSALLMFSVAAVASVRGVELRKAAAIRAQGVLQPYSLARGLGIVESEPAMAAAVSGAISALFAGSLVRVSPGTCVFYNPLFDVGMSVDCDGSAKRARFFRLAVSDDRQGERRRSAPPGRRIRTLAARFATVSLGRMGAGGGTSRQVFGDFLVAFVARTAALARHRDEIDAAYVLARARYPFMKHTRVVSAKFDRGRQRLGLLVSPVQSGNLFYRLEVDLGRAQVSPIQVLDLKGDA